MSAQAARRRPPRRRKAIRWGKDRYRARKVRNQFTEKVLRLVLLVVVIFLILVFWQFIQPWVGHMIEAIRDPMK